MNKTLKKTLGALLSISMLAGTIVLPAATASADATMDITDNNLTITADAAYPNAKLIQATYEGDTLQSVNIADAPLNEGSNTLNLALIPGSKLMLWKDIGSIEPLSVAVNVPASATTEPTVEPTAEPTLQSWKFDFGAADQTVEEGWIAVAPNLDYYADNNLDYGFLGLNEQYYMIDGGRMDGFNYQEGQTHTLSVGGSGTNDAIGTTGADVYENAGDVYYPTSFALKVPDDTYYRIKATVTTLDPEKPATASLYTERKHPIYTSKTIAAGEAETTEFTIRVTPVYYQKSNPTGTIADGMVNVAVLGENTALASLEIEQIETARTLWVLGDSTVTDGGATVPFWPLQNYTGVGTGLTKYLNKDIAMVNEGEGGLDTSDSAHFTIVKNRIKAGDFMFVEYGHNDSGTDSYKTNMEKYYEACHSVGATLIVVAPIDRLATWNATNKTYEATSNVSNSGYSTAGKEYVDAKIAAGATDIAYADLTTYSRNFYQKLADDHDGAKIADFYFRTPKNGSADTTHPNDTGAQNLAYQFFQAAKASAEADEVQAAALKPLLDCVNDATPDVVSEAVIEGGLGGTSWPLYVPPVVYDYPLVIKNVAVNSETNKFTGMTVQVQEHPDYYAKGVVEVLNEDGEVVNTYVTTNWIENTADPGTQELVFGETGALADDQTFRAYMWPADLSTHELLPEESDGAEYYSSIYTPAGIEKYIIPGSSGGVEDFNYIAETLRASNSKYLYGGSSSCDDTLGTDGSVKYTNMISNGQNSFFYGRALENLQNSEETEVGTLKEGKYMFDADLKYLSGGGFVFQLGEGFNASKSPFVSGNQFAMFRVGNNGVVTIDGQEAGTISGATWTNVRYTLDMNTGKASLSVAGGNPVTVDVAAYKTYSEPETAADTYKWFIINGERSASCGIQISNMTVAKVREDKKNTLTLSVNEAARGSVTIDDATVATKKVLAGETLTVKATANEGSVFSNWTTADGTVFSRDEEISVRMYDSLALTANFVGELDNTAIASYSIVPDKTLSKVGGTVNLSLEDVQSEDGIPVKTATNTDVTWSCDEAGVTISDDGVVTLSATEIAANTIKQVTIKGVLNGVEKTCVVRVYTYAFYEPVENAKTAVSWDGAINTVGAKSGIAFPVGNTTSTLTLDDAVTIGDGVVTLSYIASGSGSDGKFCGQPRHFQFYDSNGNKVINEVIGYSWQKLAVGGTLEGSDITGGTDFASAVAMSTWSNPVTITINTDGTGKVSFGGATADITINSEATDIKEIRFVSANSVPGPSSRGLNITDITISK